MLIFYNFYYIFNTNLFLTHIQNLVSLVENIQACNKQIFFWNWRKDTFYLFMRHKREFYGLFKFCDSLNEIVESKSDQTLSDVVTDEQ